ncbi:MAG: type II toxin-antitoxin system RelE/ParE family toxin [Chloroflexi bacterium]|nr:type II toxin-antitoxin system RelE/ParE family toxin [Chloroflexota bacterium]
MGLANVSRRNHDEAERDLKQLDKSVAKRIYKRLRWLEENFERIVPEPLSGPLSDSYKFRVGDYRVLYDIVRKDKVLLIHRVRHRRDVYKEK